MACCLCCQHVFSRTESSSTPIVACSWTILLLLQCVQEQPAQAAGVDVPRRKLLPADEASPAACSWQLQQQPITVTALAAGVASDQYGRVENRHGCTAAVNTALLLNGAAAAGTTADTRAAAAVSHEPPSAAAPADERHCAAAAATVAAASEASVSIGAAGCVNGGNVAAGVSGCAAGAAVAAAAVSAVGRPSSIHSFIVRSFSRAAEACVAAM